MYRSHTKDRIDEALCNGEEVWELDTGNDGEDDVLIGSRSAVVFDLCSYYEVDELPAHWTLRRLN
jgi:hypothetical protein